MSVLPRNFYQNSTVEVAKNLLGKVLVREFEDGDGSAGMIVESEAYLGPDDKACHSSKGRTKRTEVMFGPAGHAYIYLVYGMHYMFNIVTEAPGEAVLVRALEPAFAKASARQVLQIEADGNLSKRGLAKKKNQVLRPIPEPGSGELASSFLNPEVAAGPGKLTKWLDIDKKFNGWDLTKGEKLWVATGEKKAFEIVETERIGVDYAGEWAEKKLHFYIRGNPAVSKR